MSKIFEFFVQLKKKPLWLRAIVWFNVFAAVMVLAAVFADTAGEQLLNAVIICGVLAAVFVLHSISGGRNPNAHPKDKEPIQLPETTRGK